MPQHKIMGPDRKPQSYLQKYGSSYNKTYFGTNWIKDDRENNSMQNNVKVFGHWKYFCWRHINRSTTIICNVTAKYNLCCKTYSDTKKNKAKYSASNHLVLIYWCYRLYNYVHGIHLKQTVIILLWKLNSNYTDFV